jgi:hypothetical protein
MLLKKGIPREEIEALKPGDFFIDSSIVSIQRKGNITTIVTLSGAIYHAHLKRVSYNLFKRKEKY